VAKDHQIQPSSFYIDNFKPSSGDYNRCFPDSVGNNIPNNKTKYKDKLKKKINKLFQEEKNQLILLEKGNLYYPTSLGTSKWSYSDQIGLNKNQKLKKDSTEIVKLDEETNLKPKKIPGYQIRV
jgi:hypothetical protein